VEVGDDVSKFLSDDALMESILEATR